MDEVDGMFKGDRGGIEELLSYISVPSNRKKKISKNNNRKIPIICICNIGNVKKETIKSLQKECYEIKFHPPDNKQLSTVMQNIASAEGMTIDEPCQNALITYSQGDFRRMICIMEFLYVVRGHNIKLPDLEWAYGTLCHKIHDVHITESIRKLINEKLDGHTIHNIYDGDKSKAPMVVHQNYLRAISVQRTNPFEKIDNALACIDNLIISDIIEKTMYNTQSWYLQPVQGYTCTTIPNYYINKHAKTCFVEASWASVLSVNSQSQNLKKNIYMEIYNVDNTHAYSIRDIQTIIEVVFHKLIHGQTENAILMLLSYNLSELDECLSPDCRKKALLIIDKVAKYIKISSYYTQWAQYRDKHKSDKVLDVLIKKIVAEHSSGVRVIKSKGSIPFISSIPTQAPKKTIIVKSREEQTQLVNKRKVVTIKIKRKKAV